MICLIIHYLRDVKHKENEIKSNKYILRELQHFNDYAG